VEETLKLKDYELTFFVSQIVIMKFSIALLSLVTGASAFVPNTVGSSRNVAVQGGKDELIAVAEKANPFVKFYDPLNLADKDFWGKGNEGKSKDYIGIDLIINLFPINNRNHWMATSIRN